jgi:4'-phosphopantetheinyl transferase
LALGARFNGATATTACYYDRNVLRSIKDYVIAVVAVVSDPIIASALIGSWSDLQDRADVAPSRRAECSLLARAALRALLARNTGRMDWVVVRTPLGKPFVLTQAGSPGPAVSISHSGATVAVAMANCGALGIDIEQHRTRDFTALAAQAFGPDEQAEVAIHGKDAFYRIWTLREAIAKATGDGLALAANGRDLVAGGLAGPYHVIEHGGRSWQLAHVRIEPACSLAVAHVDAPEGPWALRWCDLGLTARC